MRGLGWPVETSQTTFSPCMSTCCSCNEEEWAAFSVSWQDLWFAAILAKSRLTGLVATAATAGPPVAAAGRAAGGGQDRVSATMFSEPGMCRISVVNLAT
jgi:hypothetical protein